MENLLCLHRHHHHRYRQYRLLHYHHSQSIHFHHYPIRVHDLVNYSVVLAVVEVVDLSCLASLLVLSLSGAYRSSLKLTLAGILGSGLPCEPAKFSLKMPSAPLPAKATSVKQSTKQNVPERPIPALQCTTAGPTSGSKAPESRTCLRNCKKATGELGMPKSGQVGCIPKVYIHSETQRVYCGSL
ncbi:hypothetical protein FF38_11204 [Lucilia cuprina]|uniref:Uncharacterized protein n=1 Tax=Lucilia cuprina TaxID=7375 RepID=A0A0L0BP92_LUCCU|nr:hypothetical protein FF38_11204 [Lucilia cuprina]